MSKAKLDKDFDAFNLQIDKQADEEIKNIRDKTDSVKAKAVKIGETVELSLKGTNTKQT